MQRERAWSHITPCVGLPRTGAGRWYSNVPSRDWLCVSEFAGPAARGARRVVLTDRGVWLLRSSSTLAFPPPLPATDMFQTLARASLRRSLHTASRPAASARPARLRAVLGASAVATSYFVWNAWYGQRIALDAPASCKFIRLSCIGVRLNVTIR